MFVILTSAVNGTRSPLPPSLRKRTTDAIPSSPPLISVGLLNIDLIQAPSGVHLVRAHNVLQRLLELASGLQRRSFDHDSPIDWYTLLV